MPNNSPLMNLKNDDRPHRNGWAPGEYTCICQECDKRFWGDKRAILCADCAYKGWRPTHRHGETGALYRMIYSNATLADDKVVGRRLSVCEAQDGSIVIFNSEEFYQGYFAKLSKEPRPNGVR